MQKTKSTMIHKFLKFTIPLVLLPVILSLSGCKVGPSYTRPAMKYDSLFRFAKSADTSSIANTGWIELFRDTVLQRIVKTALKNNYTVRIAYARVEEARASLHQVRGQQWPQISAQAAGGWQQQALPNGKTSEYSTISATGQLSWEIDLWGKLRRSKEAARAGLFAQEAYRQSVRISLIGEIVSTYFSLLELDNELKITRDNVAIRQTSLELVRNKMTAGTASGLVVAQAEAELATATTRIPALEMKIGESENYLSILMGEQPHMIRRGLALAEQISIPAVRTPGIPAQLILRRPDVMQAEQSLIAANANIGVARAMMLPSLGISGSIGSAFNPANMIYSAFGNLVAPVFGGGYLRAGVNKARAQQEQLLYSYQLTLITAIKEVSDRLLELEKLGETMHSQQKTVKAAQTAFDLSNQLYDAGFASYLDVINAQQSLFAAQINLSMAESNALNSVVSLYSALGGGWK